MTQATQRSYILHMFTPGKQMSPFDINMAVDAGYQIVVPYTHIERNEVRGLTQDAIFSRGPKGVARTGIFIGGRDAVLAADMLDDAKAALQPPFSVSLFADPSGGYTTAAAMLACVERQLRDKHGTGLEGRNVLILGGTGPVGRIAGVLAVHAGAGSVRLASHSGAERARKCAEETCKRFDCQLTGVGAGNKDELHAALADADVVLATAAAGVQVMSAADRQAAPKLLVAADVNAVPPEGIADVGVMDDGKPLPGSKAVGIGALAIGNVKYQVQHRLLVQMRESDQPLVLSFDEAFVKARDVVAPSPKG
jgi:methylene-tetrahydromethanopterin dehydrogenase